MGPNPSGIARARTKRHAQNPLTKHSRHAPKQVHARARHYIGEKGNTTTIDRLTFFFLDQAARQALLSASPPTCWLDFSLVSRARYTHVHVIDACSGGHEVGFIKRHQASSMTRFCGDSTHPDPFIR